MTMAPIAQTGPVDVIELERHAAAIQRNNAIVDCLQNAISVHSEAGVLRFVLDTPAVADWVFHTITSREGEP